MSNVNRNAWLVSGYVSDLEEKTYGGDKSLIRLELEIPPPEWKKNAGKEKVEVTAFGKSKDLLSRFGVGDYAEVKCRVGGREYNGRWYLSAALEDVLEHIPRSQPASTDSRAIPGSKPTVMPDDLPF